MINSFNYVWTNKLLNDNTMHLDWKQVPDAKMINLICGCLYPENDSAENGVFIKPYIEQRTIVNDRTRWATTFDDFNHQPLNEHGYIRSFGGAYIAKGETVECRTVYYLVDCEQRYTKTVVLLLAIAMLNIEIDGVNLKEEIKSLLYTKNGEQRYDDLIGATDNNALRALYQYVFENDKAAYERAKGPLIEMFKFYRKKLKKEISTNTEVYNLLRKILLTPLYTTIIPEKDAPDLFDSLNSKNTKLNDIELFRNKIFEPYIQVKTDANRARLEKKDAKEQLDKCSKLIDESLPETLRNFWKNPIKETSPYLEDDNSIKGHVFEVISLVDADYTDRPQINGKNRKQISHKSGFSSAYDEKSNDESLRYGTKTFSDAYIGKLDEFISRLKNVPETIRVACSEFFDASNNLQGLVIVDYLLKLYDAIDKNDEKKKAELEDDIILCLKTLSKEKRYIELTNFKSLDAENSCAIIRALKKKSKKSLPEKLFDYIKSKEKDSIDGLIGANPRYFPTESLVKKLLGNNNFDIFANTTTKTAHRNGSICINEHQKSGGGYCFTKTKKEKDSTDHVVPQKLKKVESLITSACPGMTPEAVNETISNLTKASKITANYHPILAILNSKFKDIDPISRMYELLTSDDPDIKATRELPWSKVYLSKFKYLIQYLDDGMNLQDLNEWVNEKANQTSDVWQERKVKRDNTIALLIDLPNKMFEMNQAIANKFVELLSACYKDERVSQ